MTTVLSVNLNKIALLRNSRGRDFPSVRRFAQMALESGAGGITLHPRPDQRHARYADVHEMRTLLQAFPQSELNIEGNPTERLLEEVLAARPHQCTLVPDSVDQLTSDHGYDLKKDGKSLVPIVKRLQASGVRVSIFMDPVPSAMPLAAEIGVNRVELYTESFAEHYAAGTADQIIEQYQRSAEVAHQSGLRINAGHDLNLSNLGHFLAHVPYIDEVSIGHALTVEALETGFRETIKRYLEITTSDTA